MTDTIPAVNSTWTRSDGATATVTEVTAMHGRTKIAYNTAYPGTDRQGVGMSDLSYFLNRHMEANR